MPSAVLMLNGSVTGIPEGPQTVLVTWNLPNAVAQEIYVTLAIGDNLIPVPTGPSGVPATVLIVPPNNNGVAIQMKESLTDAGIALHPQVPCFRSIAATVPQFWLTVGATLSGPVRIVFW